MKIKTTVLRDGGAKDIPLEEVVPGDIVSLNAGDSVPADSLILDSKDLFVDEATLTGETYPVEKTVGPLPVETPLSRRTNSLFMGTHVISGSATAAVVFTGKDVVHPYLVPEICLQQTVCFCKPDHLFIKFPQETEFERGVARFGYFLMEVTLALVSWEKDGEVCCCTLIKVEGLTEMIKGMLGPVMKTMI